MNSYLAGSVILGAGLYFLLLRSRISRWAVDWNYRILRVRFDPRGYEVSFAVVGAVFIAIGVLTLAGIVRFP